MNNHFYKVNRINKIVDGDTIHVEVDCGFHIKTDIKVRLKNVNAPEIFRGTAEEKALGHIVKEKVHLYVTSISHEHDIFVKTQKQGSFKRWLGVFYYMQDKVPVNMNDHINKIINEVTNGN